MTKAANTIAMALGLLLGGFFIYKGLDKHFLSGCKVYTPDSPLPIAYQQVMTALCSSGFTKIVGAIEVLSGLLLLIPRTRMIGAFTLLPVIINIFLLHAFLDNRSQELVETGIPLVMTIAIIALHYPQWKRGLAAV